MTMSAGWVLVAVGVSFFVSNAAHAVEPDERFTYRDEVGVIHHVAVERHYWRVPIVHPPAKVDAEMDPHLMRAATIAQERANAYSKARCWRYVKEALLAAHVINSYPRTPFACQAGTELVRDYGFKRLSIRDPYAAPLGAVLVYGAGASGFGHVELRTRDGFASDYFSKNRCRYPLVGVYAKQ